MAPPRVPEIAVVTRTYSGQEGNRVRAGTRFAVVKAREGMTVISLARYNALRDNKLARPLGEEDSAAVPARAGYKAGPTEIQGAGTGVTLARSVRERSRRRVPQNENPTPPKALAPAGSQTGKAAPPSLSLGDQASKTSTSTGRGTRRTSASSQSTTPSR